MQDLNPWERMLMDWLGRRSLGTLVALPMLLFVAAAGALIAVASLLAHRSPIGDTYVIAVIAAVVAGGLVMYFACIYVLAALFIRTPRFKLLRPLLKSDIKGICVASRSEGVREVIP